jgi:AcrR family transcriptional regulator
MRAEAEMDSSRRAPGKPSARVEMTGSEEAAPPTATSGRRERKKAATRQALADAALELFLDRGFDQVGVREIAEAADVSTANLFKHFATKESLVFDLDADREAAVVAAVRERTPGLSVITALRDYMHASITAPELADPRLAQYISLIEDSQGLREYSRRMWLRHENALAQAIFEEAGRSVDIQTCRAVAHFALESRHMIYKEPQPAAMLERIFDLLEAGWSTYVTPDSPVRRGAAQ